MNPTQPAAKKACDKCRLRKIKCDLTQPCASCTARNFECTYQTPHRKRGPAGRRLAEIRQQQGWRSAEQLQTPTISPGRDQPHLQDGDAIDQPMTASWDMLGCLPQPQQPQPDAWPQSEDEYLMPSSAGQTSQTSQNAFDDSMFSLLARPQAPSSGSLHPRPPSLPDPTSIWPLGITDENLIRWIDVYFERLYPTLPILKRSSIFARLLSQEHRTNPDFGAMLLALSAFSLIQPVRISEWSSASSRENMVNFMLSESVKMRASVEFGENPSLDAILTSVFLFACLFQRNQHNAAWFRLKEAVELGSVFGLGRSECYANCEAEQKQQRLRIYYLLAVTERAYALEKKHPITFLGHPSLETRSLLESVSAPSEGDDLGIVIHDEAESNGMLGLLKLMTLFDPIDENFVRCWNGQCDKTGGRCRFLDEQMAITIYENLTRHSMANSTGVSSMFTNAPPWFMNATLKDTQVADLMVNEQWLQNRFWNLCLSHRILSPQAEHPALQVFQAVTIAENTLRVCSGLSLSSLEVHGVGTIEKLYCIVESAVAAKRYSESISYGAQVAALSPHAFNNTSASLSPSDPLIHGFLDFFKKIRAGQHPFLGKLSALVGQELGVDSI
ncbi:putative c6 transcription protein [Lasiodiplodia theobromae]|uniref:C6 transcription protein n=1 Tax=Lasiodiplodia theobromae TaxID=45133 RepID=A0A5N5D3C5_9PEZI|nr:C6 transcription factor [Lasiodiplodia theobromae]KAB2571824.1 Maltose fermentation regulatory protein MAL13 [Lasiodiplodia theobromae]KAF4539620.1 C6 transcription factor [Lasiodiplodia theobromae]KAF9630137.1 putative c6 transcription protein [Lasiodiplodia theobromae]